MDSIFGAVIDDELYVAHERAFERIDADRTAEVKPSEVKKYLDRNHSYDLGERWEDWWRESGEEWT